MIAPCLMRPASKADVSFIYNSWLKSFYDNSSWAKQIPPKIFFDNHKKVITHIMNSSGMVIAANPDEPSQIFGYGIFQQTSGDIAVIHYLYVKQPYRKLGIGTALFDNIKHQCRHDPVFPCLGTHSTRVFEDVLARKWNVVFNPYVSMEAYHEAEAFEGGQRSQSRY